ncbi:MAG: tetratricopeptide repeat protein [Treponema sp.]|nr:tetratricopeptide repeat protein [Treponema sp.]
MRTDKGPHPGAGDSAGKLAQAIQAGQKRDYKRAILLLEEILSGFDAPPEACLYLGRSLHALKDYSRALASFNDYVKLRPQSAQGFFFAGRSYLTINMPHRAVQVLRKAHSLRNRDTPIMALLGLAYLKSRHSQMAVDILQRAVETAAEDALPQNQQTRLYHGYINALLIRGIRLCRNEDYETGSQMLRFVLENGGDSPLLRLELGRACRETGLLEEALEHYGEALKEVPDDPRIRWYRASILMSLGENAEALEEISRIRATGSGLPDLPWNSELVDLFMIRSFMDTGEWRRAADACRLWIKHRGPDPVIHASYAEALRNLKEYPSALNHLERATELDPGNLHLWYERILVAWEGENWKALRKALRVARTLGAGKDLTRRFSILLEAKTSENNEEVIGLLQEAIHSQGPEPELMSALGERYLKIGFVNEALNWFRKTVLIQDHHERARLGEIAALGALAGNGGGETRPREKAAGGGLLSAAERRGEMRTAEKYHRELRAAYDDYVRRWPDNYVIRRERALYLLNTFEYAEAVRELENLLVREPSNPSLRRVLAYGYRKTGRFREAAVFLKALLKENPGNIQILLEYSGCLQRAGGARYAVAVLEKAVRLFSKAPELYMALALLQAKEKKLEKAFDLLREAAALNGEDPRPWHWMAALARKAGNGGAVKRYEAEERKRLKK